jgi:hypothetical protein
MGMGLQRLFHWIFVMKAPLIFLIPLGFVFFLAGCATSVTNHTPVVGELNQPAHAPTTIPTPPRFFVPRPPLVNPPIRPEGQGGDAGIPPSIAPQSESPTKNVGPEGSGTYLKPGLNEEKEANAQMILPFLAGDIADKKGWAQDISYAFDFLKIAATPENICSVIAIIQQESSFQVDPVVSHLSKIALAELEKKRQAHMIPLFVFNLALKKTSKTGQTYFDRIKALKTEKQLSQIYIDMIDEIPFGKLLFSNSNPITTAGAMQVKVSFAQQWVEQAHYPYPLLGTVRDEVFTRKGGVFFGIARLLGYPYAYASRLYYFADYNAGPYSSRNAAFQFALSKLSGFRLELDGDLLVYRQDSSPSAEISQTKKALLSIKKKLQLSEETIFSDLKKEKLAEFDKTKLWQSVFALYHQRFGDITKQMLPRITLKSPKLSRTLSTAWFAEAVEVKYERCLRVK